MQFFLRSAKLAQGTQMSFNMVSSSHDLGISCVLPYNLASKTYIIVWFEIDFLGQNMEMVSESWLERIILKCTFVQLFILDDNVIFL